MVIQPDTPSCSNLLAPLQVIHPCEEDKFANSTAQSSLQVRADFQVSPSMPSYGT
jgi:hypothetical protein